MEAECDRGEAKIELRRDDEPDAVDLVPILENLGRMRQVVPGESLWPEDDAHRNLYLIEAGAIKLSQVTPNGQELVVGLFFEGEVIGLQGLSDTPDADLVTALEPTRVRVLPLAVLRELCLRNTLLHREIIRLASQRIAQLQQRMMIVGRSGAVERVAGFVIEMSSRRAKSDGWLRLPLSLNGIGDYLCMTLETVCRSLRRLEQEGLIHKRGRFVRVLDCHRLIAFAGEAGFAADRPFRNI